MFTQSVYRAAIKAATLHNADDLVRAFAKLSRVHSKMGASEEAYWTLPRSDREWRLPADDTGSHKNGELLMLPVRDEYYANNAYLAVVPQPIIMHRDIAHALEQHARNFFKHYPVEDSLARRKYNVPMLIGRFDVIVDKSGGIQICELDDVCSLWPALPQLNPIAATYSQALEDQMGLPIYTAELFQYSDGAQPVSPKVRDTFARIAYINEAGQNEVAYIPRSTSLELAVLNPTASTATKAGCQMK